MPEELSDLTIEIGRTSGPMTDKQITVMVKARELDTIKDVLAWVNACTHNTEGWFVMVDGKMIIPQTRG